MNPFSQFDWHVVLIAVGGAWSVFWSFAPTPEPNTWYNAFFHTAMYLSLNPGRSVAVIAKHRANGSNGTKGQLT